MESLDSVRNRDADSALDAFLDLAHFGGTYRPLKGPAEEKGFI